MVYPIKTEDQLLGKPYTEFSMEGLNVDRTKRMVYCQYCKYSIEVILYGAKCGQCRSFLINITTDTNVKLA